MLLGDVFHSAGGAADDAAVDAFAARLRGLAGEAGTESCELPHVAVVLQGRLHVRMDDGSEEEFGPDDVMMLPPGHDARSVGDAPCVFVEFSRGNDYYE